MALWLMVFGHLEGKPHREHLLVVDLAVDLEAAAADKRVLYVIMDLEMGVLAQVVADKVVMAVQVAMAAEALLVFI